MKMTSSLSSHSSHLHSTQHAMSIFGSRRSTMLMKSRKTTAIGIALSSFGLVLTGCGIGGTATPIAPTGTPGVALHGLVYGGQQPLVGAVINLYAAGTTGYGSPYPAGNGGSVSLLGSHVVTTDASGSFNITGDYTCPTGSYVYIEAVGGSPDGVLADNNPNVIMLAALGLCSNLSSSSYITMNELTTVASVWALAPFMTGPTNIGTKSTNPVGLANAFASVNTLVNIAYGQINTTSLPAGATIPTAELNTLGNILAACVNVPLGSAGAPGNACTLLFPAATPSGGTQPTDTLTAAMNIAQHPGNNVSSLFPIAAKYAQFGPSVLTSAPTDWTVSIRYTANAKLGVPLGVAADQQGNIWVTNAAGINFNTGALVKPLSLVKLYPSGTFAQSTTGVGTTNFGAVAIDPSGNAWVQGPSTTARIAKVSTSGTLTTYSGTSAGMLNGGSYSIAVDGSGNVWAGQSTSISEITNTGTAVSGTNGFTGGGLSTALSIAITPH